MIQAFKIVNYLNEELYLDIRKPEDTGFLITSVTGLDYPKASIATQSYAAYDGVHFSSIRVDKRNIVMHITFYEFNKENLSIEDLRWRLQRHFIPKTELRFCAINEHGEFWIKGYIESCEINIFSKQEKAQISIVCPDPYFAEGENDIVTRMTLSDPLFHFPVSIESETDLDHVTDLENTALQSSKNLYDPLGRMDGYCIHSLGRPAINEDYNFSGYIDISGCTNITAHINEPRTPHNWMDYAFYDEHKNPVTIKNGLGEMKMNQSKTFIVPSGAVYFGFSARASYFDEQTQIMVQSGTTYTGYEPHIIGNTDFSSMYSIVDNNINGGKDFQTRVNFIELPNEGVQAGNKNYTGYKAVAERNDKTLEFARMKDYPSTIIEYNGSVITGFKIDVEFLTDVREFRINHHSRNEYFAIDDLKLNEMTGLYLSQGDRLIVNTYKGNRSATFIRHGVSVNILGACSPMKNWPQLQTGKNVLSYTIQNGYNGTDQLVVYLSYRPMYLGI